MSLTAALVRTHGRLRVRIICATKPRTRQATPLLTTRIIMSLSTSSLLLPQFIPMPLGSRTRAAPTLEPSHVHDQTVQHKSGRLKVARKRPKGLSFGLRGWLGEAAKAGRPARRSRGAQWLQPLPSVLPGTASSHKRSNERRGQAGRSGGCNACVGWIGMLNGWSRAFERCGSTCR